MNLDAFALALGGVRSGNSYNCFCPAHDDTVRSLSVGPGRKHPIVFRCHRATGCSQAEIIKALTARGLWPLHGSVAPMPLRIVPTKTITTKLRAEVKHKIVATYSYVDEMDHELFQVVRLSPKTFRQRHRGPDDKWVWNLNGVRRVLYHLPRVLLAVRLDRHIFVTEGEKDADALTRAFNLAATTAPMGAQKWLPEYSESLRGARVVVLPDWDDAGLAHAKMVVESLRGIAHSAVVVLALPPQPQPKCDVSDWLASGGTLESLINSTKTMEAAA